MRKFAAGEGGERTKINIFLVILMSFYLLFIGSDDTALLLICYHDMNVFCNFTVCSAVFVFIKTISLELSKAAESKREKLFNYIFIISRTALLVLIRHKSSQV